MIYNKLDKAIELVVEVDGSQGNANLDFAGALVLDDLCACITGDGALNQIHKNLIGAGCRSQLVIAPERWHGYVLYSLEENAEDGLVFALREAGYTVELVTFENPA